MRILLIRHGESEADILRVHEGRADFPLTARGHAQAEAMAAYVAARYRVDRLYASTLTRAMQTARHLAGAAGIDIIPDDDLMEFNNGLLAGLPYDVARQKYPPVENLPADQAVYGMESRLAFRGRAEAALAKVLAGARPEETVAVVSHGGMIDQLWHVFLSLPVDDGTRFATGDTGIHEWQIDGASRRVIRANYTGHAEGI